MACQKPLLPRKKRLLNNYIFGLLAHRKMNKPHPVSPYAIALRLGRTPQCVQNTIRRLKLRPVLTLGEGRWSRCYYHPDAVEKIRAAMRTPNRRKES
jgi:hypothetical protein